MFRVSTSYAPLWRRQIRMQFAFGALLLAGLAMTLWLGDSEAVTRVHFSNWVQRHYGLLRQFTDLGLYPFYFFFLALLVYGQYRGDAGFKLIAQAYVLAQLVGSFVVVRALKVLLGRARPDATPLPGFESEWTGFTWDAKHHSFPSGHTADIVTSALFMALLLRPRWAAGLFLLWAVFLAFTRLALAKHYPSDALVGAVIALAASAAVVRFWLLPRLERLPAPVRPAWWRGG